MPSLPGSGRSERRLLTMHDTPEWVSGPEVVHLDPRRGQTGLTPCCGLRREDIPYKDRVTIHRDEVTCPSEREPHLMNPAIQREAALSRRAGDALNRLLIVRRMVDEASPDTIDAEFRNRLLKLIDWGKL